MTVHPTTVTAGQSRETAQDNARRVLDAMAEAGIRVACTLPETWLAALMRVLADDDRFTTVPVAREEEGVGILAGAYFGGQPGALLMSNSGFMTCCCALNGLASRAGIPMLMMIVQRGELGESQVLQGNVAEPTVGMLTALGIPHFRLTTLAEVSLIGRALRFAYLRRQPVAVLMERDVLLGATASAYWYRESSPDTPVAAADSRPVTA